jgi:chemotaxis protein MotB
MSAAKESRIVVKKVINVAAGHHGGGWKIAYADFMTAMFAFFLVMWLLSVATPKQREGIAEHFKMPLKVALAGGDRSGISDSVIPGGGDDPTRVKGEVDNGEAQSEDEIDAQRLADMKERLDKLLESSPVFKQFRSQILIDITNEGLRLQIVDNERSPMFDLASAKVVPHMRAILREIGPMLNDLPNKITLSGHTDAFVYTNGDRAYGNWELSADRANASRRELMTGGMADGKVMRVIGVADTMHLDKADPRNPINRRISIILLNHRAQTQMERENAGESSPLNLKKTPPTTAAPMAPPASVKTVSLQPASPTK